MRLLERRTVVWRERNEGFAKEIKKYKKGHGGVKFRVVWETYFFFFLDKMWETYRLDVCGIYIYNYILN